MPEETDYPAMLRDLALGIWHLFGHLIDGIRYRIKEGHW